MIIPEQLLHAADQSHIIRAGDGWRHPSKPLPKGAIERHMNGGPRYGVPFVKRFDNTTMAGMIDIDDHDGSSGWVKVAKTAEAIINAGDSAGIKLVPFRSNGGAGINLWCIWEAPQQALAVKSALAALVAECGLKVGAGGLAHGEVEVFPKQSTLGEGENGSAAALPRTPLDSWDFVDIDYAEWAISAPLVEINEPTREHQSAEVDVEQLREILEYVPVEGLKYDKWWPLVMAIKDAGGSKEMAEEWSRGDPNHKNEVIPDHKWDSIKNSRDRRVTAGTLMYHARKGGWPGFGPDIDQFPVATTGEGEMLIDYALVPGKGRYGGFKISNTAQVQKLLSKDPEFPWRIAWDDFRMARIIGGRDGRRVEEFQDHHYVDIQTWLDERSWEPVATQKLREIVNNVAKRHRVNTAQAWLESLAWDGIDRFPYLAGAMGAESNPYYLAIIRYMMTAHAERVLSPGCQADAIIVLISEAQGLRKSSAIQALAPNIGGVDTYQNISIEALLSDDRSARALKGCLIANMDEMRDFGKREAAEIKSAITKRKESYTPKYLESREEYGRSCLFYATNNHVEFLDDETGSRRYHPIIIGGRIDDAWIAENREQLWAQGATEYRASGQAWRGAETLAPEQHKSHAISDPWDDAIQGYIESLPTEFFTSAEVLSHAINMPLDRQTQAMKNRVGAILKRLGYKSATRRIDGKVSRRYSKV